jgi:squalene-hopene/tetraprenyl-beta-curcumene cyclase
VAAHQAVRAELLGERTVGGHWVGELSSSPLATAAAVSALVIAQANGGFDGAEAASTPAGIHFQNLLQGDLSELIVESLHWLAERQNADGGWGDTDRSRSNIATTLLVESAFRLTGVPAKYEDLTGRADEFLEAQGGIATLRKRHGRDKSLTAPILSIGALAGLVPWRQVPALPFEYVGLPHRWYCKIQLPIVSCAMPLLASVGPLKFHNDPPRNPLTRVLRLTARKRSLQALEQMQSENGGFLESPPMTAFVVASLASTGHGQHPLVRRGVEFLLSSVRSDASWAIESNLATKNTALAINALAEFADSPQHDASGTDETVAIAAPWLETTQESHASLATIDGQAHPPETEALDEKCLDWLLEAQRDNSDPVTGAAPGGWSWTELAGAAPEADDTSAVLIALVRLRHRYPHLKRHRLELAARRGVEWLLDLQNGDGGWPTFCRGWSLLPADCSAADVTAHAIRSLAAWQPLWRSDARHANLPQGLDERITAAIESGLKYLEAEQRNDGSFVPLWFGNQHHAEGHNLVYGTAQVLITCAELGRLESELAQRAARWLLGVQHANGGWGPPRSSPATSLSNVYRSNSSRAEDALASFCSVEETSLAIEALLPLVESNQLHARAVKNGLKWLVDSVEQGRLRQPSPIGFYFARLWYYERLYPLVYGASALRQAVRQLAPERAAAATVV